jgi:hypothetical protein
MGPTRVSIEVTGDAAPEFNQWLFYFLGVPDDVDAYIKEPQALVGGRMECEWEEGPDGHRIVREPTFGLLVSAEKHEGVVLVSSVAIRVAPFCTVFHDARVIEESAIDSYCAEIARRLYEEQGGIRWLRDFSSLVGRLIGTA